MTPAQHLDGGLSQNDKLENYYLPNSEGLDQQERVDLDLGGFGIIGVLFK